MTRNHIQGLMIIAFPALVVVQCATFYMSPFPFSFITGAPLALYGTVLLVASLWRLWSKREGSQSLVVGLLAISWLGWVLIPTHEFSLHVRFWLKRSEYDHVVAQVARGERPGCLATNDCMLDGNIAPYVVFPFSGSLAGWIGMVYVPELGNPPNIVRLKAIAADPGCDPKPIAPHYYICGFS